MAPLSSARAADEGLSKESAAFAYFSNETKSLGAPPRLTHKSTTHSYISVVSTILL